MDEKKKLHLKFQQNFHAKLLDREIGRDRFKNEPIRNSYHHSYQLLSSLYPDHLEEVDINKCEPSRGNFRSLNDDADCLGFSPDGRYMAFHSHGRSAITVLKYCGVENSKNDDPLCCFAESSKVELETLIRNHHYNNEKATRSWWTDDSTTIVLQVFLEDYNDGEEGHDEPEEEMFLQVDDITGDSRGFEHLRQVPNPIVWDRAVDVSPSPPEEDEPRVQISQNDLEEDSESDIDYPIGSSQKEHNVRVFYKQESSGIYEDDEFSYEDHPKISYHRETSRTMPYYVAVESAAQIEVDEQRVRKETSRTMPVYHSLVSSADPKSEESSEEEGPLTSNPFRRIRNTRPLGEGKPNQKRQKEDLNRSRNGLMVERQTGSHESRSVRQVGHKLRACSEYARNLKLKGSNSSGLGYTRREAEQSRTKKNAYSDHFRDIFDCMERFDFVDVVDKIDGLETTILFFAFNVETESMSILEFEKVAGRFDYHARDRDLVFSIDSSIQMYHLSDKEFICCENFRLSETDTESLQLKFHTGTTPGLPSEMIEEQSGTVLGDLYDLDCFLTPIQQDVATLFHRDAPDLFEKSSIPKKNPIVKRIRSLSHDLLAISLSYPCKPTVLIGVIVSTIDHSIAVYPDYHEFLKLLFTHHLPDLLPRHWTLNNPFPVVDQLWFRNEIIDISKPEELSDLTRLNSIYEFLHKTWHNPKTVSNPLQSSVFHKTHAYQLYCNYLFSKNGKISFKDLHVNNCVHMEQYFHPSDPFKVIKSDLLWYYAVRKRDPKDVIVNTNSSEDYII